MGRQASGLFGRLWRSGRDRGVLLVVQWERIAVPIRQFDATAPGSARATAPPVAPKAR
jgi:hypothetical protein